MIYNKESCAKICCEIIKKLGHYLYGPTRLNWFKRRSLKSKVLAGIPEPIRNYINEKLNDPNCIHITVENIKDDEKFNAAWPTLDQKQKHKHRNQQQVNTR